ncbi:MAG: hypothetical protein HY964_02725 [Ignavibacteriales bacterium]|nr:hypothetical protein [Ignavibacteriales bacterium]
MAYENHVNRLASLETFEPNVFKGDENVSQNLCDFILALTLAYNDLRDLTFARIILNDIKLDDERTLTTKLGFHSGLRNTITRIQTGFIRELLVLVAENKTTINEPSFKTLVQKLSKKGKKSWLSIQTVSCEKTPSDALSKALIIIRNKVAFHYDATQLGKAYKVAFLQPSEYGKPLVSRGSAMSETRFYFADAAAQQYIRQKATEQIVLDFLDGQGTLLEDINQALYELITKFINSRSAWQKYKTCMEPIR